MLNVVSVVLYKCNVDRGSCSFCWNADQELKCGWCYSEDSCMVKSACAGAWTTYPKACNVKPLITWVIFIFVIRCTKYIVYELQIVQLFHCVRISFFKNFISTFCFILYLPARLRTYIKTLLLNVKVLKTV